MIVLGCIENKLWRRLAVPCALSQLLWSTYKRPRLLNLSRWNLPQHWNRQSPHILRRALPVSVVTA